MGLPNVNRLREQHQFRTVYEQGRRQYGRCLSLRAIRGTKVGSSKGRSRSTAEIPPPQIGIVVSQKVSKKAVIRNRIKRQIRAACRMLLSRIPPGWWLVIVAKPKAQTCEYKDFLRELEQLLIKAEVLHGHPREHLL